MEFASLLLYSRVPTPTHSRNNNVIFLIFAINYIKVISSHPIPAYQILSKPRFTTQLIIKSERRMIRAQIQLLFSAQPFQAMIPLAPLSLSVFILDIKHQKHANHPCAKVERQQDGVSSPVLWSSFREIHPRCQNPAQGSDCKDNSGGGSSHCRGSGVVDGLWKYVSI
jgi:hypothetical protein